MKKGSKSKASLPNQLVEVANERFVIEIERKSDIYTLKYAGCTS